MPSVTRPVKTVTPQIARSSRILNLTVAQQARPQLAKTITRPVKQVNVQIFGNAPPGGLTALEDDASPTLGGNLNLNGFTILGLLDAPGLVLDSGLLEAD